MKLDFHLDAYKLYLELIKTNYKIIKFEDYFSKNSIPKNFCIIRHDVDRKPDFALEMANIEKKMGINSTYYFRFKNHTFKPKIIKNIHLLGHEIGYHYECMSDMNGDIDKAVKNFKRNLEEFRKIVPVRTISMHGRPFKKFDNRDMWRNKTNKSILKNDFGILGEVYLDISYDDIAYINDTGRNWLSNKSNLRDKIESNINSDFNNKTELINALKIKKFEKIIFQIHPGRWANNIFSWLAQFSKDLIINMLKKILLLRHGDINV